MTDHWKDVRTFDGMVCGDGCIEHVYYQTLDGTDPSGTRGDYAWVHEVDTARAKDAAEIARLTAQVQADAHLRSVVELYRADLMAMAEAERIKELRYWLTLPGYPVTSTIPDGAHRANVAFLLAALDAARAREAGPGQMDAEAHAAEIARLHDIIAAYEAVIDPEQHPDLFARSSEVLEGCSNPVCSDQAVVQDLRDQLAAKDAEIARLTAQVRGALLRPDTDGDGA